MEQKVRRVKSLYSNSRGVKLSETTMYKMLLSEFECT